MMIKKFNFNPILKKKQKSKNYLETIFIRQICLQIVAIIVEGGFQNLEFKQNLFLDKILNLIS